MTKCPACESAVPDLSSPCPSCGRSAEDFFAPTRLLDDTPAAPAPAARLKHGRGVGSGSAASSDSIENARFVPGDKLGERYRIAGLLGRGGMGEVYRADDLKLKQPVALKLLPESLSQDGAALARFYREVSVARQVSHRHVCRVYDVGEHDGQHFLSMEYVRGEELASLLKRIGRLPHDKAVETARQLSAGLAAIHEQGVLHRDLKPANVMLDERGDVRITDFGLAAAAEDVRDPLSGTPAYMSPEQIGGAELTPRSDIYSLGLVLYELFTGRRVFEGLTVDEIVRGRRADSTPPSPSSVVKDLDPVVERVILRCLEADPSRRPASALQVAAALPGGDPLAAALAAGETPSPEMVAAAPTEGALRPAVAVALLAAIIAGLLGSMVLAMRFEYQGFAPLEKSADVLRERAREISREFGHSPLVTDDAHGFITDGAAVDYIREHDPSPERWRKLKTGQPPLIAFWYRQGASHLEPFGRGSVNWSDPPREMAGMSGSLLDTRGRLLHFYSVPPQVEDDGAASAATSEAQPFDWSRLFHAAGFEPSAFKPAKSRWAPPYIFDERAAWEGVYPDNPQIPVRVEAAAYRGRPIYFEVVNPWDRPTRQEPEQFTGSGRALFILLVSILVVVLVGSVMLAVRNLRRGRGDRRGAFRLFLFLFPLGLLIHYSNSHHTPTAAEYNVIMNGLAAALFETCVLSLVYLALEPYVRRRWPHRIISWSRLMAGDFRDPLVGRDFLVGALAGVSYLTVGMIFRLPELWSEVGAEPTAAKPSSHLLGIGDFPYAFANQLQTPIVFTLCFVFLLLLLSVVLRGDRKGAVAGWAVVTSVWALFGDVAAPATWLGAALISAVIIWVTYRYGMLAICVSILFMHFYVFFPFTTDITAWYASGFTLNLFIILAATAYAFRRSLGGQTLLRGTLLDD